MTVLILAAGYGTRMAEVTGGRAKPLVDVGGQAVLDYLLDQLSMIEGLDRILLITNELYREQFEDWSKCTCCQPISILSDGTRSNEERLGAIGDLWFAIETAGIDDDVLITGADNIFRFPVGLLVEFFQERDADCIAVVREPDPERLKRTSTLLLDDDSRVVDFVEKAAQPLSDLICPPLYALKGETLPLVADYLDAGNNADAPGNFIAWLHKEKPVYGKIMPEGRLDIGNPESYREAQDALAPDTDA